MAQNLLDDINRKLILLLEENPNLTDAALARRLNLAQSTVASRRDRLGKGEIVTPSFGLNVEEIGLQTGIIEISTLRPDLVLEWVNKCPLFVNASKLVAGNHLSLFFVGEDTQTFHDIIAEHLLKIEGVSESNFTSILSWERGFFARLDLTISASAKPPCDMDPFCHNCPANPRYSGKIWKKPRPYRDHKVAKDH